MGVRLAMRPPLLPLEFERRKASLLSFFSFFFLFLYPHTVALASVIMTWAAVTGAEAVHWRQSFAPGRQLRFATADGAPVTVAWATVEPVHPIAKQRHSLTVAALDIQTPRVSDTLGVFGTGTGRGRSMPCGTHLPLFARGRARGCGQWTVNNT